MRPSSILRHSFEPLSQENESWRGRCNRKQWRFVRPLSTGSEQFKDHAERRETNVNQPQMVTKRRL